jgi:hypothetical protein
MDNYIETVTFGILSVVMILFDIFIIAVLCYTIYRVYQICHDTGYNQNKTIRGNLNDINTLDFTVRWSWDNVYLIEIPSIHEYRIELDKSIQVHELGIMNVILRSIQYVESLGSLNDKNIERKYLMELCENYDALISGRHNKKKCIDKISKVEHAIATRVAIDANMYLKQSPLAFQDNDTSSN